MNKEEIQSLLLEHMLSSIQTEIDINERKNLYVNFDRYEYFDKILVYVLDYARPEVELTIILNEKIIFKLFAYCLEILKIV